MDPAEVTMTNAAAAGLPGKMRAPIRYHRWLLLFAISIGCKHNSCFAARVAAEADIDPATGEANVKGSEAWKNTMGRSTLIQDSNPTNEEDVRDSIDSWDDDVDEEDDEDDDEEEEDEDTDDDFEDDNAHDDILDRKDEETVGTEPQCGIWVAPSTIQGAGLGMFAGQDFQEGQTLEEDIAIPIVDLRYHHPQPFRFLFDEYTWSASFMNMFNLGFHQVEVACPGFGATANSFLPVANVREWNPSPDDLGLHRSKDPGAGAFTPYHRRRATATRDILDGEELFVDYGEEWFKHRSHLGPIPLTNDLIHATDLFQSFVAMKEQLTSEKGVPASVLFELWDLLVKNTTYSDSRVIGGFHHHNPDELALLESEDMTLTDLRIQQGRRSPKWLAEHGTCADHLEARPSTIPQAGRGAFTRRFLPNGTIISQLPLIHILDYSILDMYHLDENDNPDKNLGVMGKQILTNYCYGHTESTLLLCPYGPLVNFINHNKTLANVKIQWSDPRKGNHNPALLDDSLEALGRDATAKLAFELVALRDIQANEEIFLDYGDDWERAWLEHVIQWQPADDARSYKSAQALNEEPRIPTEFELLANPSLRPDNVELWCYGAFKSRQHEYESHRAEGTVDEWIYGLASWNSAELDRCDNVGVREDNNGELLYTTVIWDDETEAFLEKLVDVPRQALLYLDRPYTADIHLNNTFRHSIGIPDDLFPKEWRNKVAVA